MDFKNYFNNRTDTIELDEFSSLFQTIQSKINNVYFEYFKNVSFIMLKPNAYLSGMIPEILGSLEKNEIYVFKTKLIIFTEKQLDQLYMFVKKKYNDSWWVMKRLYELAPCLPTMVIGPTGKFPDLSARIRDIVGPTTPIIGDRTKIRYAFNSTHRIFNTIHATDDPASSIRENLVFFGLNDLIHAAKAVMGNEFYSRTNSELQLIPDEKISLDISLSKCIIKKQLFQQISPLLSKTNNVITNKLNDLIMQLGKYVDLESSSILRITDLQQRFKQTSYILDLQRICITSILLEANKVLSNTYRNMRVSNTLLEITVKDISRILRVMGLFYPLTDDGTLMSLPSIEKYLSNLLEENVRIDNYTEVLLLGCWAGAYNELQDISLKWPLLEEK